MPDPRVQKLARLLVEYAVELKPGDLTLIRGDAVAAPLIRECYRAVLRAGAHVELEVGIDGLDEIFYAEANAEQLRFISPLAKQRMQKVDVLIGIWADENTKSLSRVEPARLATRSKARQPLSKIFMDRSAKKQLRWVGTQWPCQASAQDAEMSLEDYENFVFGAGHLDDPDPIKTWKRISKEQQALTDYMNGRKKVRIVAEDTDLTYSCAGRTWINCDGHYNFPDGEVFTGPVESSVEGHIAFSFPAVYHGREVEGARLWFEKGKVVKAEARKGEEYLKAMIAMDKGSCWLGEAAIATNYNIVDFSKNTLFDEKIGGTIHVALGAGYPETGNSNQSGLHWDMVCDLRKGGEIIADGEVIQRNGRFLNKKFPQPLSKSRSS